MEFIPPSKDHDDYAKFIVDQLVQSIEWDCSTSHLSVPIKYSGEEYRKVQMGSLEHSIDYYTKMADEEVARVASRNVWLKKLRKAIDDVC